MEALLRKDGHAVNQPDRVLAEHFAEGLKDREVKQQNRLRPQMSFVELRVEVIQQEEERPPQVSRRQMAGAYELAASSEVTDNVSDLQRVLSALEQQQHIIEALTERVERMEGATTLGQDGWTATVLMGGVEVNCLLDTGSQVSTITESFFRKYIARNDRELAYRCKGVRYTELWVCRVGCDDHGSDHTWQRYPSCLRFP